MLELWIAGRLREDIGVTIYPTIWPSSVNTIIVHDRTLKFAPQREGDRNLGRVRGDRLRET